MFWPTQSFNVYGHDPVAVGVRSLPVGFSILTGACVVLWLLRLFRGHNKELLIVSSVFMTAGMPPLILESYHPANKKQGCGAIACARVDNMGAVWAPLVIAGLGIGGIVVPASIITTIICPVVRSHSQYPFPISKISNLSNEIKDLIATVAALTLSIRVIGGSIGYCVYYNVFISKFIPNAQHYIGGAMVTELGITNTTYIIEAIELTGASLLPLLKEIPGIKGNDTAYEIVLAAGQLAYAESYKYVYYVSISFGVVSILAAWFLGDIQKYMDDHVAVVIR